jgi:hypothetical protein
MFARSIGFATALFTLVTPCLADTQTRISAFEYDPVSGQLIKEIIEPLRSGQDPDAANAQNYYQFCLVTSYEYDSYGNKKSVTTRNCNSSSPNEAPAPAPTDDAKFTQRTSSSVFGAGSNWSAGQFPTSSTNALGHPETRTFDPRFGSVLSLLGPNQLTTSWTPDSFGRKSTETRVDTTFSSWFYERCIDLANTCPNFGQYRVRVTATGAPTSSVYYDSLNREIRTETQGFDGTLARKDTVYDGLGRVSQVSRPYYIGAAPVWTLLSYDDLGRLTLIKEPATLSGQTWTVTEYNGLITKVTVSNSGAGAGMPDGLTQIRTTTRNSQGQVIDVTSSSQ